MAEKHSWALALRLGVDSMDEEHGVQVKLLESIQAMLANEGDPGVTGESLDELYRYSEEHFAKEEALMRFHSYPRYAAHVEAHRQLLEQLRALRARFAQGEYGLAQDLVDDLRRWLGSHIHSFDRDLAHYVALGGSTQA